MEHLPGEYLHAFHGGLRLKHHKRLSCDEPAQTAPLPEQLVLPLRQHQGSPALPQVAIGDHVRRGDCLATASDSGSIALHAPTSGVISDIGDYPTVRNYVSGEPCIVLRCDGEDRAAEPRPLADWQQCPAELIVQHLQAMGLSGLGGALYPSHRKLGPQHTIDTVILNGAECEPYLSCDEALMLSQPAAVIGGAAVLKRAASAQRVVIALEDRMDEVRKALQQQVSEADSEWLRIVQVPTYYPEGGERQLIQVLTGQEVPSAGLPQDLGLVCFNVATAAAACHAVVEGRPLTERMVTVTGHDLQRPGNWLTRIGTPLDDLLQLAGGAPASTRRLIMGGPLMGVALPHANLAVDKGTNCLLLLREQDVADPQPQMPCINCGYCVKVCPAQLLPQELHWAIRAEDYQRASDNFGLLDCIECGCCDQVCPSHIPLVEEYRLGKQMLWQQRRQQQQAEHARQRYQARGERLQRRDAERSARREARKAALRGPADAQARLARALARKRQQQEDET
ncbi:MAG: hypothetical protein Tsb002_10200 [Wenzhouxiangellaceae bacterium]